MMSPEAIRLWRIEHHLTQLQLADLLLVSVLAVRRWEYGQRSPVPFLRLALAELDRQLSTSPR